MTPRERLQMAYEFAFNPKMLHAKWHGWLKNPSACALYRLAFYQAAACDYGMRTFIASLRRRLNRPPITETEASFGMVRDVVLSRYGCDFLM